MALEAGDTIGLLGSDPVLAHIDGRIRGLVRAAPGGVARGTKLVEIDPRPDAPWRGVPIRAQRIASGVETALGARTPATLAVADASI